MIFVLVGLTAFLASLLKFFSGFGLATVLTPVFALFFNIETSIAIVAVVHLLNNIFKLGLVGKLANKDVVFRFGLPAIVAASIGAKLLESFSHMNIPLYEYSVGGKVFQILTVKLVIAVLILFFTLFESLPLFKKMKFDKEFLSLGGFLSGFFGGLSGHQGALRTTFLSKLNLSKESFVATGVVIACAIDVTRIFSYWNSSFKETILANSVLVVFSALCGFAGAYVGSKVLKSISLESVQKIVTVALILLSFALGSGLI